MMESTLINFNEGDNSSPDLPCGQKDWREVENKAEVHQARPNCHCQVDIYFQKKNQALKIKLNDPKSSGSRPPTRSVWRHLRRILSWDASHLETKVTLNLPPTLVFIKLCYINQPHHLSLTGTTIAIGKILKVVE